MRSGMRVLLVCAGLLMWPCVALAQLHDEFRAAALDVATQLAQRFPPVLGEVVEVRGEQVYLSVGRRDHVLQGMRLDVFREGEELTSPTTGEVLAWLEEDLGNVTVTQVAETYAVAIPDNPANAGGVQTGDKARITAGRLHVGLLPISNRTGRSMALNALMNTVLQSLHATGRFHLVPSVLLAEWLVERGLSPIDVLTPGIMSEAARAWDVTYMVQPVLRDAGGTMIVELRLFAPAQPENPVTTAMVAVAEALAAGPQPAAPTVPRPSASVSGLTVDADSRPDVAAPGRADKQTVLQSLLRTDPVTLEGRYVPVARFSEGLRGFDAADIDGDGRTELVILGDTRVSLHRVHENQLVPIDSYSDRRPGTFLSAQLVRLGDSQMPGVVVNRYSPNRKGMDSFLLVIQDNQLVRQQTGLTDIMVALDADGDGVKESVWGQRFDDQTFFRRGQVTQYELKNGRLKRQGKVVLPTGFRATGVALAQFSTPGDRQLVFVDDRQNLQVYQGSARRWKSPVDVGGSYVFASIDIPHGPGVFERVQFDFEAIPAVADFDGDGIDEVLVPQNQSSFGLAPNLNLYRGGQVLLLRQTPQGFVLSPVTPGFDGLVSGVAILKGRRPGILVAVSKREGVLRQKKQTIIFFGLL